MEKPERVTILYPGEMGAAVGRALSDNGMQIVSYVSERSTTTRRNAEAAGFEVRSSLEDAVAQAELVISLVPPTEALHVAGQVVEALRTARQGSPIYLDANSISPTTMRQVAELLSQRNVRCMDGAFVGQAERLGTSSKLLLSGPEAEFLRRAFERVLRVQICGEQVGAASALKMRFGAFNKGLVALFLETALASERVGITQSTVQLLSEYYPESMAVVARLLPSYPKHVGRRLQEMTEVQAWQEEIGETNAMARGTIAIFEKLISMNLDRTKLWDFDEILEAILSENTGSKERPRPGPLGPPRDQ